MHGTVFQFELSGDPPKRLAGVDIHRTLCGIYDLKGFDESGLPRANATYELREGPDYERVKQAWDRYNVMRNVRME